MFAPSEEPPELSHWIVSALLCALAYALYNIFIKKGSASIHPILGEGNFKICRCNYWSCHLSCVDVRFNSRGNVDTNEKSLEVSGRQMKA